MPISYNFQFLNSTSCFIEFGLHVDELTSIRIAALANKLEEDEGIEDSVASYTTLLVMFDPRFYNRVTIKRYLDQLISSLDSDAGERFSANEIVIPVYYDPEVAPDLMEVAAACGVTVDAVIKLHSETVYRAYAIGFTPGYAYLGNLNKQLQLPRKSTPRLKVTKGSVAIAEQQTAVYPSDSPGGWHIIGRTPIELIDWQSESLSLLSIGDHVRFEPISRAEYQAKGGGFNVL